MTLPSVERCGYIVTPVLGRDGCFNPAVDNMRIGKDGGHALFPARLYRELNDEQFAIIAEKLWYQPDSPTIFELPNGLTVRKEVVYMTMSQELYDEGMEIAAAHNAYFAMTDEQRVEHHRAAEAERTVRLARQLAAAESLIVALKGNARIDAREGGTAMIEAVLGLHRPQVRELAHTVTCSACWDGGEYDDNAEWPCPTIEAIKGAS